MGVVQIARLRCPGVGLAMAQQRGDDGVLHCMVGPKASAKSRPSVLFSGAWWQTNQWSPSGCWIAKAATLACS